ncbi:alpha/beta fold hydrolase [Vibrio gallicus]|uniref:alpha/beta fold hydrolase n=1 Tax=Vibrio gallicus TaxID=190897 RepID=UPI0021C30C02|nr:alpha/beta hydrolase [Vibrio gallicus]
MDIVLAEHKLKALRFAPDAPTATVLLLHGWLDNAASFEPLIESMQRIQPQFEYIALDLPGHGLSSHSQSGFYPFHDYLDVLHQVIGKLSRPVHLVGHSLGALIASCYSATFPEHVASLTQIEGYGPMFEEEYHAISRLKKGIQSRQRIVDKPARYFADISQMITLRATTTGLAKELVAPIVYRDAVEAKYGWQWRHDKKLKADSLYRMPPQHAKQVIAHLPTKNLLVLGKQGFAELPHRFVDNPNPNTQLIELEGGHHCHMTSPEPLARAFFELLAQ